MRGGRTGIWSPESLQQYHRKEGSTRVRQRGSAISEESRFLHKGKKFYACFKVLKGGQELVVGGGREESSMLRNEAKGLEDGGILSKSLQGNRDGKGNNCQAKDESYKRWTILACLEKTAGHYLSQYSNSMTQR